MSQVVEKLTLAGRLFTSARSLMAAALLVLLINPVQAETYYFHNDHLGTPQVVTDDSQQVVWKGEYDPFGQVTETVALVEQNLRFPGQYFDVETGLHYNYFRSYDPVTGRYVESDPIGVLQVFDLPVLKIHRLLGVYPTSGAFSNSLNLNQLYIYVDSSPGRFTDQYGLNKTDKWYGHNDKDFRDWVHQLKQDEGRGAADNYTKKELDELKNQWIDEGRPGGKGRKSGKGGQNRFLKKCLAFIAPGLAEMFYPSPQRACDIYQDQPSFCALEN